MSLLAAASIPSGTLAQRGQCLLGLVVFLLLAFAIGRFRGSRGVPWRVILWGVALQFAFASVVLFSPSVLAAIQFAIDKLLSFTLDGARMVFGSLVNTTVPATVDGKTGVAEIGFTFAFIVLPTIVFISLLTAVLYHLKILPLVVRGLAWLMRRTMGTSGAETLSTAANIFVGQTEAPLIIRPFLELATRSELMAIMVGGFANIATGVLVLYSEWLSPFLPAAGGHLAAACFISAPATLVIAKLLVPETETPATTSESQVRVEQVDVNVLDAATRGTSEGLALALNVGAMLIAFTALLALLNALLSWATFKAGLGEVTIQKLLGYAFSPLAWLSGVSWAESKLLGQWLGLKTALNELIAYAAMKDTLAANPAAMSPRSVLLSAYALCGFANFASVGIQIGGISTLAPSRRSDLSRVALLAMFGGMLATLTGACVVGVLT